MRKTTRLTILEIMLMVMLAFCAGAIGGFFLDALRKKVGRSGSISKEQHDDDFRKDLEMEMGELR